MVFWQQAKIIKDEGYNNVIFLRLPVIYFSRHCAFGWPAWPCAALRSRCMVCTKKLATAYNFFVQHHINTN
jgi:hypothetical protein